MADPRTAAVSELDRRRSVLVPRVPGVPVAAALAGVARGRVEASKGGDEREERPAVMCWVMTSRPASMSFGTSASTSASANASASTSGDEAEAAGRPEHGGSARRPCQAAGERERRELCSAWRERKRSARG